MRRLPITLTAMAGTVTAGLLVAQTPILSAVGDDDHAKRDEDTPSVRLVDDGDDKDTGKDTGTPSRVSKDASRADVTRSSRVSRVDRVDRTPAPIAADDSEDRPSRESRDQSVDDSNG